MHSEVLDRVATVDSRRPGRVERWLFTGIVLLSVALQHVSGGGDSDTGSLTAEAVWAAAYGCALFGIFIERQRVGRLLRESWPLVAIVGVAILSTLWSDDAFLTLRRSFGLLGTTIIAVYVVCRYSLSAFLATLVQTIIIVALGSMIAIVVAPEFGVMQGAYQGAWRGLFWEKNRFGESMAIGIFTTLLLSTIRRRRLPLWLCVAICTTLMLGSRSATAVVGVITAYIALFFADRLKNKRFGFRAGLMAIGLVVITLCAVEIGFEPQDALNVLGRDTTLTGRTQIWSTAIQYIGDRPLLGYGYQVFWEPDGPVRRYLAKDLGWEPVTAHNGYLEIGLDFGLVGLLLFSIFLCEAVRRSITYLRTSSESVRAWPFVVIIGLAAMNFADANVVLYNEFLWVIFMIAFLYATVDDLNLSATNRHEFENVAVPLASNG